MSELGDTIHRWWVYACVAVTVGATALRHARRSSARRRARRRAGAW